MRLKLTIERQGLRPECLLWSTSSLSTTSNPPPSSSSLPMSTAYPSSSSVGTLTFAQLLDQVNGVIPLECDEWGLEDYVVEVGGFECLHFAKVADLLKDDDAITIRPLQTQEVRLRTLGGRVQVSRDGRHLYDGVGWGRPFVRRAPRPEVRLLPRRNSMAFVRGHDSMDDAGDEEYEEGAGDLDQNEQMLALPNPFPHELKQHGMYPTQEQEIAYDHHRGGLQTEPVRQGSLRPAKRRLESPFQPVVGVKRAKSAQHVPNHLNSGRTVSLSNKSVHFDDSLNQSQLEEADTPATIYDMPQGMSSDDDDDDDFSPDTDEESDFDEADKENHDPLPSPDNRRPASIALGTPEELNELLRIDANSMSSRHALAEVDTSSVTPSNSDEDNNVPSAPTHHQAAFNTPDKHIGSGHDVESETSDVTSSEDYSDSDSDSDSEDSSSGSETSDTSEISSEDAQRDNVSSLQSKGAGTAAKIERKQVPPGYGSNTTRNRNKRKRQSAKLAQLKGQGLLPESANFQDLDVYLQNNPASRTAEDEFQIRRQQLLQAIENGGVDVDPQTSRTMEVKPVKPVSVSASDDASLEKTTPHGSEKRRRLDKSASERLLFNGLGLRVPKNKGDAEKLRQESRSASQTQVNRHQRGELGRKGGGKQSQEEMDSTSLDTSWQEHVTLYAVECTDPSISYTTPPFPFEQRWDPQQSSELWRQNRGKRQKKERQKLHYGGEFEEHYEANMYDDPVADDQAAPDTSNANLSGKISMPEMSSPNFSDLTDLTHTDARLGAKIAFKTLHLSEETSWMPVMSDFKIAEIVAVEQDKLTLRLDEAYRPSKPVDPETGERIFSNFRIEAMDLDEDDSILELSFGELDSPKLIAHPSNPSMRLEPQAVEKGKEKGGGDSTPDRRAEMTHESQGQSSISKSDTMPETSFGASTHTLIGDETTSRAPSRQAAATVDADARREASLLIHEAGFRSSVDPEARQPLSSIKSAAAEASQNLGTHIEGDETEFNGFSSSQVGNQSKGYEGDAQQATMITGTFDHSEPVSTDPFDSQLTTDSHQNSTGFKARKVDPHVMKRSANDHSSSRQEAVASTVDDTSGTGPDQEDTGASEICHMMMSGALPLGENPDPMSTSSVMNPLPDNEDEDANVNVDAEDAADGEMDSQDSLMSLDSLLASSQRLRDNKSMLQQETTPSNSQPATAGKNTRLKTRRASAMASAVTLSDDDGVDEELPKQMSSPLFASTAPASFKAINGTKKQGQTARHSEGDVTSQSAKGKTKEDNQIDLTALSDGEANDSSSDDSTDRTRGRTQASSRKGKDKEESQRAVPRTRSEI